MNIAVIPARGGSKRIPRKNLIDFFGHPMIAYTIAAAHESQIFERIIVSTDDQEIAEVAESYGAEVVHRPLSLASNEVPVSNVVKHAVEFTVPGTINLSVCMLMGNCPLRTSEDIRAHSIAFRAGNTAQVSVVPFCGTNPKWAMKQKTNGEGLWMFPDDEITTAPSQTYGQLYCPTGAIWWTPVESLRKSSSFYSEGFRIHPLSFHNGWDIDDTNDLEIAKILAVGLQVTEKQWPLDLSPSSEFL